MKPRLGQHFLTDPSVIQQIVSTAAPTAGEHFVEIGPGRGALTGPLLSKGAIVHAVEIDPALAQELRERFPHERLSVHLADALEFDYSALDGIGVPDAGLRLIGNLPYYLSTPLLFRLLESAAGFRDMTVMLQREVAERLCAPPGSRRYGRLSVTAAVRCRAEPCFSVAPGAFEPRPKVHSMVVRLTPDSRYRILRPDVFERVVRQAFSQRRKTIANALRGLANKEQITTAGIDPTLRPEQIPVQAYLRLSEHLD
ncbi:MAG: 16S rRNA (adenine(1518)-N(6)/adenine(1519)-N(6))-dimethyltransferase RsmA [Gammaproteobacteria bacterium]|nr:16S rRNA (adenine(1518)-N(6)/adenine(1519)-N(6))-dimethyltransferase RsmA [Gammaproteobacteria bacterium]MYF59977.1 16S rRNA (adenine(1518)-N(6)/adenine(1519)-N(6))-dimethyltransferase RsmA [Gammaproteobacteria bacterium]